MTLVLKQHCSDHEFERIELNTIQPFNQTEQSILSESKGYLRRIAHKIKGKRVVYARAAFPKTTFELMQEKIEGLRGNPIGNTLYGNPAVKRSQFYFKKITRNEVEFADVFEAFGKEVGFVWARYSVFYWCGKPFTLQEFFVPDVLPEATVELNNRINVFRFREKCIDYIKLIRLHRPIPILLLVWPMYWALWIAASSFPGWKIFIIFTVGAFLMRSAGDIFNDLADRKLDKSVARTKHRPLATERLSVKAATNFALFLCLAAFVLVLFLNWLCVLLSFIALGLAIIYPFMKRLTYWPQAVLGIAYNWGIVMAFAAVQDRVPLIAWFLLLLTVIWTIAYDTLYALADQQYDIKMGIKSTAVKFGRYAETIIAILDGVFLIGMALLAILLHFPIWFYLFLIVCIPFFVYQLRIIKGYEIGNCIRAFANNHWIGLIIFSGIWLHFQF